MPSLAYGSLFSGAGGFELGLEKLGWELQWMCEKDPYAASVLRYHWDVPLYDDVATLVDPTPVDIIVGGFPCQDLSKAGKKMGLEGQSSGLFYEFVRIVREMREATNGQYPRAVIWENVPGIINKSKDCISSVYTAWAEIGALVQEHRLINAEFFGVPQRRKRVIGIVIFDPTVDSGREILFESSTGQGNSGKSGAKGQEVAGTTEDGSAFYVMPIDTTQLTSPHNKTIPKFGDPAGSLTASGHAPKIVTYSVTPMSGQGADLWAKETDVANTLTAINAPDRGIKIVVPKVASPLLAHDAKDIGEPEHKLITEVYGTKYRIRQLTEIECERLMGWPDDHTALGKATDKKGNEVVKKISMTQRRKMCGNGLVAPVAEWAGRRVEKALNETI